MKVAQREKGRQCRRRNNGKPNQPRSSNSDKVREQPRIQRFSKKKQKNSRKEGKKENEICGPETRTKIRENTERGENKRRGDKGFPQQGKITAA